ncbi:MAG: c-type cytochrome [Gammaproteobacteria bacterium]
MRFEPQAPSAETFWCALILAAVLGSLSVSAEAADLVNGEALFLEHCSACHTVIERVRDKSGPNLHGLLGRRAGSEDYSAGFTEEMVSSGLTWEIATVQAFVNAPSRMVRGTKMVFRGLPEFDERIDLACYLEQFTNDGNAEPDSLCVDE